MALPPGYTKKNRYRLTNKSHEPTKKVFEGIDIFDDQGNLIGLVGTDLIAEIFAAFHAEAKKQMSEAQ